MMTRMPAEEQYGDGRFVAAYVEHNDTGPVNALYERPAVLRMAGDVDGLRVLDVGCGAGALAQGLRRRGAIVTGLDRSEPMLAIARDRLGPSTDLRLGDLRDPLPFDDGDFDLVVASLVLHYLRDWEPLLRELHRVLVPDGRIIASTHHPFMDHVLSGEADYFATYLITEDWTFGDQTATMAFWHRPLRAMLRAFDGAGFEVGRLDEPEPDPVAAHRFPEAFASLSKEPRFLFFELHRR